MIKCDASENGLGAALLPEGQTIVFASVALIDNRDQVCANREGSASNAIRCDTFVQYTFRHIVTVQSDHTPMESILNKAIFSVPKLLQGISMPL